MTVLTPEEDEDPRDLFLRRYVDAMASVRLLVPDLQSMLFDPGREARDTLQLSHDISFALKINARLD